MPKSAANKGHALSEGEESKGFSPVIIIIAIAHLASQFDITEEEEYILSSISSSFGPIDLSIY